MKFTHTRLILICCMCTVIIMSMNWDEESVKFWKPLAFSGYLLSVFAFTLVMRLEDKYERD